MRKVLLAAVSPWLCLGLSSCAEEEPGTKNSGSRDGGGEERTSEGRGDETGTSDGSDPTRDNDRDAGGDETKPGSDETSPNGETGANPTGDSDPVEPADGTESSDVPWNPGSSNTASPDTGSDPNATSDTNSEDPDTTTDNGPSPLTSTTFVFERKVADGNDHVVAMDYITGAQRVITTLAEGSVEGWNVDGITVSPDRTRLVLASRYGATAADVATGLSTNILWNLDVNGGDFQRLTPVFENTNPGTTGWRIDVRDPAFSPDGQFIVFDYGEGDFQGGYVAPWVVPADGSSLPSLLETDLDCSVNNNAAFNPVTGDLLLSHVVCLPEVGGGYYLYPSEGGAPDYLINEEGWSLSSEPPSFSPDGSVFVFTATTYSDNVSSLYAYISSEREVVTLVPGAEGIDIVNAAFAPDNAHIVYCVEQADRYDLRVLDLGAEPPTDIALTDDGVSCDPVF